MTCLTREGKKTKKRSLDERERETEDPCDFALCTDVSLSLSLFPLFTRSTELSVRHQMTLRALVSPLISLIFLCDVMAFFSHVN